MATEGECAAATIAMHAAVMATKGEHRFSGGDAQSLCLPPLAASFPPPFSLHRHQPPFPLHRCVGEEGSGTGKEVWQRRGVWRGGGS
ncbi:hypothetical protein OsI_36078 [Oryza sativa Indica Group]|uniref:Os11g0475500 protein n=3 Tax=Oryza sativa TaxID=4530 RepID=Q0ISR3_ORYSJ|nr:hypothetical protein [Oryza sativa]EEC68150.1 hypothetical protein OsI_36078 [Oryza sativa Indica Group]BAF28252.1 Os11g0475500 [Oryza sativa Japonica Group]|eukprot:NP_001067889.1 Os11g0475500 [Oryza sativa Japonica Group]